MIKILYIINIWGNGGIEKVITNYCENLSKDTYDISILPIEVRESVFTSQVLALGVKFLMPSKEIKGNLFQKQHIRREIIVNEVKKNQYDIIHYHNSLPIAYSYLKSIKEVSPASKLILHSHGDSAEAPFKRIKTIQNCIYKKIYKNVPDFCASCSERAGMWLFDERIYRSSKYKTLVNAFNTVQYAFDINKRNKLRSDLSIKTEYVFGTIGRFCYQKYPEFTLEIIKELKSRNLDFTFIWVGNGPQFEEIAAGAKKKNCDEQIIFIKSTDNVPQLMSALDAFILPSRFEGLGLVLVEALSAALPCLAADTIPRETRLTDRIKYLSLNNPSLWADEILDEIRNNKILTDERLIEDFRRYPQEEMDRSVFNLNNLLNDLELIYKKLVLSNLRKE